MDNKGIFIVLIKQTRRVSLLGFHILHFSIVHKHAKGRAFILNHCYATLGGGIFRRILYRCLKCGNLFEKNKR